MPKSNADRIAKLEHECRKQGRIVSGLVQRLTKLELALAAMRTGQQAEDEAINALQRHAEETPPC